MEGSSTETSAAASLVTVARGDAPADLLISGARVLDVFTRTWFESDIAISGGRIAGFGRRAAHAEFDAAGAYLTPGLIDAHVHIESSKLLPSAFADVVAGHGTTGIVADPHEIANALGSDGVAWFAQACADLPIDVALMAPSCVPASPLESPRQHLPAKELAALLARDDVHGLGEMMNFPAVIRGDAAELTKIAAAGGKPVDGHAPGVSGPELDAYIAAGIGTDHECTTLEAALDRRRRGMWVLLREASNASNLVDLLPMVREYGPDMCAFCTDDREPDMLLRDGHINHMCRLAVAEGISPADALVMATINVARAHGLHRVGAIAPGYYANLALWPDLSDFEPAAVWHRGQRSDTAGAHAAADPAPEWVTSSINCAPVTPADFAITAPSGGGTAHLIELIPHQLVTRASTWQAPETDGVLTASVDDGVAKLACVERHHASGRIGLGFVRGFGLQRGALASSIAHDAHNLLIAGMSDADMCAAVDWMRASGGGVVVVDDGNIIAALELPVAGLLAATGAGEVAAGMDAINAGLASLGCTLPEPAMALSFLGLTVIPEMRVSDQGLVDVNRTCIVPVMTGAPQHV